MCFVCLGSLLESLVVVHGGFAVPGGQCLGGSILGVCQVLGLIVGRSGQVAVARVQLVEHAVASTQIILVLVGLRFVERIANLCVKCQAGDAGLVGIEGLESVGVCCIELIVCVGDGRDTVIEAAVRDDVGLGLLVLIGGQCSAQLVVLNQQLAGYGTEVEVEVDLCAVGHKVRCYACLALELHGDVAGGCHGEVECDGLPHGEILFCQFCGALLDGHGCLLAGGARCCRSNQ